MSVYDNETSKIHPDLTLAAPWQTVNPQNYRLAKMKEVEDYFLHKIDEREILAKELND